MTSALLGQRDLLVEVARALNAHRVPYLLSGSFASSFYGIPRATHDIDFVVEIGNEQFTPLRQALEGLGREFAATAKELTRVAYPQMVNTWHAQTGVKIDFWITDAVDFSLKYARRQSMTIGRTRISLIAPEDLILTKLVWCKELRSDRHIQDCIGIWRVQKGKLDEGYLDKRTKALGVVDLLREVTLTSPSNT